MPAERADASYRGPLLIRGGQLDGSHELRFSTSFTDPTPTAGWTLMVNSSTPTAPDVRQWSLYARVQAPGCYGGQVDGVGLQETIVFQVRRQP
jgi:hypothetical protein